MFRVSVDIYKTYKQTVEVLVDAESQDKARDKVFEDGVSAFPVVNEFPNEFWEEREVVNGRKS